MFGFRWRLCPERLHSFIEGCKTLSEKLNQDVMDQLDNTTVASGDDERSMELAHLPRC